jgi:hypothetical protein
MPVMERTEAVLPPEAMDLPEVEYPPEVIARWDKEVEILRMEIATGQAKIYDNAKDLFQDLKKDNG